MDPIPHQYLHLESVLMLPFLVMMLIMQVSRSSDAVYTIHSGRRQAILLAGIFGATALGFGTFLYKLSPLLALELAAGFTLSLMHPVNALCFFVHMLFLRPWDILPDNPLFAILPRGLAVLCLFSWLIHPTNRAKLGLRTFRALLVLLAFSVWLFLSTLVTPNVAASQGLWFDTYFKSLIVFLMCSFFIENDRSVSEFKYTILLSIFAMGVMGLYQFEGADKDRLSAVSMLDPNDLAALSVIVVPFAFSLMFSKVRGFSQRFIGAVFFVMALIAIWYAQSRGALLAVLAQWVGFQVLKNYRRLGLILATLVGVVFAYLFILGNLTRTEGDLETSSDSRITYWKAAVNMTLHNPLLGVGFEQFPDKYESYSPTLKYEWGRRAAHSSWTLAFAESGLLGGILFLIFFFSVFKTAWKNRRDNPDQLYALGGYGVAMTFLTHTYLLFPYLLYGLVMASDSVKERSRLVSV